MNKKGSVLYVLLVAIIIAGVYIYTKSTTIIPYPITGTWYMIDVNEPLNTDLNQIVFDDHEVKTTIDGKEKTTTYSIKGHTLNLASHTVLKDTTYTLTNNSTDYVILSTSNKQPIILVKSNQIINDISKINRLAYSVLYSNYSWDIDEVDISSNVIGLKKDSLLVVSPYEYTFEDDYLVLAEYNDKSLIYKISDDKIIWITEDGDTLVLEKSLQFR